MGCRNITRSLIVVDGENCYGNKVHNKLINLKNADIEVVIGRDQIVKEENRTNVKFITTESGEKNAVDFVVISAAINGLVRKRYKEVIIMSDDKGFDAAIEFLNIRGYNIRRQKSNFEYSDAQFESRLNNEIKSICGFMAKRMNSGIRESKLSSKIPSRFKSGTVNYIKLLERYGYIVKYKNRIYFNNNELSAIAKNKLKIGDRIL